MSVCVCVRACVCARACVCVGGEEGCVRSVSPRHLHEKQLVVERRAVSQSACTFSFFSPFLSG